MVIDDDEKAHTIKLCQQCHNEWLTAQGQVPLESWQWKTMLEQKAHRGKFVELFGKDQVKRKMWKYFCLERVKATNFLEDAAKEYNRTLKAKVSATEWAFGRIRRLNE